MSTRLRPSLRLAPVAGALISLAASGAFAQDRCTGTLCDLYYGNSSPAKPAAVAPSTPAPAGQAATPRADGLLGRLFSNGATSGPSTNAAPAKPLVAVQGGGLIGMANGTAPSRCSGTLCDLYYGGPPPEAPARPEAAPISPARDAEAAADEAPVPSRPISREPEPRCAVNAHDPWQCYR